MPMGWGGGHKGGGNGGEMSEAWDVYMRGHGGYTGGTTRLWKLTTPLGQLI